jgi:hypothetical protein
MGLVVGVGQTSVGNGTSGGVGWVRPLVAKKKLLYVCYGPSGIAWPALGGLAGRPFCELMGFGLASPWADETDRAGARRRRSPAAHPRPRNPPSVAAPPRRPRPRASTRSSATPGWPGAHGGGHLSYIRPSDRRLGDGGGVDALRQMVN